MTTTTYVRTRIDDETKHEAEIVLDALGLTMSAFLRMAVMRVAREKCLPFDVKIPNAETLAAMEESRQNIANRKARFTNADELINDLEKNSGK